MAYKVALWPGDGIGPEVITEAVKVLDHCSVDIKFSYFDWSTKLYAQTGRCAPLDFLEQLMPFDAVLLGALGNKDNAPEHLAVAPLLEMRKGFDQYVNYRPSVLLPGVDCPLKGKNPYEIDMVVIRENTEGEYTSLGGSHYTDTPYEAAMQVNYFTYRGIERVIRHAFEIAETRERKKLISITKSNALKYSMVLWDKVFKAVAKDYPGIESGAMYVDAAAMNFVRCPEQFDVVVCSNLFGDILTDLSAVIIGGMGFAGSGNINPERKFPSMFEPVHGSAPDIAGQDIANPVAAILSAAMMLDFLGEAKEGLRIREAVKNHLLEGKIKTPDRGGANSTQEVGTDIVQKL